MSLRQKKSLAAKFVHGLVVAVGGSVFTATFFLVLPLIQALTRPPEPDLIVIGVDTADVPPPPVQEEEEEKKNEETEEKPPELTEDSPPMDLAQLELALNPGSAGGGFGGPDFANKLGAVTGAGQQAEALFSLAELDQRPRAIYQPNPVVSGEMRKRAPAVVHVIFVVSADGRVENATVQKSTDPSFDKSALSAVKSWKFEPGKRGGKAVRFRMRVPVTFPKG